MRKHSLPAALLLLSMAAVVSAQETLVKEADVLEMKRTSLGLGLTSE